MATQYMLLLFGDESAWAALTPDQLSAEMGAYMAYTQDLIKAGVMVNGDELHPAKTAKTLSISDGKQKVVDGPFVEIKEALGGYYVISVESEADAIAWAAKCPGARHGHIEIRPVVMR